MRKFEDKKRVEAQLIVHDEEEVRMKSAILIAKIIKGGVQTVALK
jgi:hypothetical protein